MSVDPETKQSAYHTGAFHAAGAAMMSFQPVNAIHQHLCAFHAYSHDRTRHVEAHHFCKHQSADFHQCVIYDSDKPDARLVGIEYIVSEKIFVGLPQEEKRYWHSHKYEVESGMLQLQLKGAIPSIASDAAEQPAMLELQKTYGKTIHTWQFDVHPDLPLGPPALMMSYTSDDQVPYDLVRERDERYGVNTEEKRKLRKGYLPEYETVKGADEWETEKKAIMLQAVDVSVKMC
ncbi:unnamed protein product [Peniophora sp. CBMAI 1063]|nr:unnamed protein product [Peniophora sp. CBMAI 1063]